ncbi:type 2 periplasmic-binding domain-containing protein [Paenibacillus hexagrammi]|uniref:hypothetical protein n=1 Tax=Paenibacillus hexagrammi TaxID=2908839 RepID=UPI002882E255|nr:hypothetical protein [Paenibacillus sp. YPD9-1]
MSTLQKAGIQYSEIEPRYLAPADARAAFEQGSVDAWAIWDPYLAAAQTATHARILSNGTGIVNNYQFYFAARPFTEKHEDVIKAYLEELQKIDDEVKADIRKSAEFLSPSIGIDVESLVNALSRREYGIQPIDDQVVKGQQDMAEAFQRLGLIPKPIQVKDTVIKADWR